MKALILGSGNCKERRILEPGGDKFFENTETVKVDFDPNCGADVVMELTGYDKLPFDDEEFDEIHAYDSLEHWGKQGDWRGFFDEFSEYRRILKDGGKFFIIVPHKSDAYADPGHVRFFSLNHFRMLYQNFYQQCHDQQIPCTDYRFYWKENFDLIFQHVSDSHIGVVLLKKDSSNDE